MIGSKLFQLINELTVSERKALLHKCSISSDKRMQIFKTYIQQPVSTIEAFNDWLMETVMVYWPEAEQKEKELKTRRLSNYFADQVERLMLDSYLEKNNSIKSILLAQALEKGGNLSLLNHYYDKAYAKSLEEEDFHYQMLGLKGKIRMSYASQNEKELANALKLNEELLRVLRHANNDKITEYYYNLSNIYLEKNSLIADRKEQLQAEILSYIEKLDYPLNKVSLYVSLAKLNFDSPTLSTYFEKAKTILYKIENKNADFYDLDRKIRFLELRLLFFSGVEIQDLMKLANEIEEHFEAYSIINNNTLFYKILFTILHDELEFAEGLLTQNHIFFKGESKLLEDFLVALLADKRGDSKKALKLLHPIMYSNNYFFETFSRLLVIKIQIKRKKEIMIKSLVTSTQRLIQQNKGNALGTLANSFTLNELKNKYSKKKTKESEETVILSVLHRYILE
jgi:hypothetical protein